LLHGDLHHKNILRDRQGGWRAIDPKGIAGVAVMETARFIQNELDLVAPDEVPAALDHMTSLFAAELGQPKRMVALCAFVDKVLSTVWGIEENYTEAQLAACMSQCDLFLEHVRQL
ncbi:MAG: aminoglycoside phosphotransferase family protein, partial [Bacillota bacterium]